MNTPMKNQGTINQVIGPVVDVKFEGELPNMRRTLQEVTDKEQLLAQQEGTMSGNLAVEEGRWQEINARLDELERRIAARAQRP